MNIVNIKEKHSNKSINKQQDDVKSEISNTLIFVGKQKGKNVDYPTCDIRELHKLLMLTTVFFNLQAFISKKHLIFTVPPGCTASTGNTEYKGLSRGTGFLLTNRSARGVWRIDSSVKDDTRMK